MELYDWRPSGFFSSYSEWSVYIGSGDGKVYALNAANGKYIWSYQTQGNVASSPAVADGMVFVGSYDGNLYALNAVNGKLVWSYLTGGMSCFFTSSCEWCGVCWFI